MAAFSSLPAISLQKQQRCANVLECLLTGAMRLGGGVLRRRAYLIVGRSQVARAF